jgi:hypothetical protein
MKTRILTIAISGFLAAMLMPAQADDPALQRHLEATREQVRGLIKRPETCRMLCEEIVKDKKAKAMICEMTMRELEAMKRMRK